MKLLILASFAAVSLYGQQNLILGEDAVKISEHVWAIMGVPNIGIVVGTRATLVVDTGLGARNGAIIARVAGKLSVPNAKLYLTTTHFHPEHAAGDAGFPAATILVRDAVQQQETELHGKEMLVQFGRLSAQAKELLADVSLRPPDLIFNDEVQIDLGGVTARLLWFGGAHTKGDELTFVEPDRTLISGDVVQNKVVPGIYGSTSGDGGTPSSWLRVLDKVAALNPAHVLPDHSAPGDGSLVMLERAFIGDLRTRALALKNQGVTPDEAGKRLSTELKAKYPDWPNMNVASFVESAYAE